MKRTNEYAKAIDFYHKTPKAVFAALAMSFALRLNEDSYSAAIGELHREWNVLHRNGAIPQKPLVKITLSLEQYLADMEKE